MIKLTAAGILVGVVAISFIQFYVQPGGERFSSAGMAVILVLTSATGSLIGAVLKFWRRGSDDNKS